MSLNSSSYLKEKLKAISLRLIIVLAVFAVILFVLVLITDEIVLEHETGFDNNAFQFLHRYTTAALTSKMLFFTFFGSQKFLFPAYCVLVLYFLFFKRNTLRSFNIAAIGLGSTALLFSVKDFFKRHRPSDSLIGHVNGFSFPSGHSFSSFTFCGLLMYITWETKINVLLKWVVTAALFVFATLIATSRVYLHVHYASDVIAGFCLSVLWLAICIFVLHTIEGKGRLRKNDKELQTNF